MPLYHQNLDLVNDKETNPDVQQMFFHSLTANTF